MSHSQQLPSTPTAAAFISASVLQAATTPKRGSVARGCEASLRPSDPRHGDARPQPATRLVWGSSQRRQQAAKCSAAAASAFLFGTGSAHGCRLWRFTPFRRRKEVSGQKKVTNVMILMSDTGGGHRASAQALQAGFKELFGDRFAIDVVDLATQHSPYPFNQASKSYNTMVKYPFLWRLGYTFTQPRLVHVPMQHVMGLIMGRQISEAFEHYQPDLVVSVHPLMQAVPLRVLRQREARGVSDRISFATVVTDLSTCHNTWFHRGVDRCFVATPEAEERAMQMGLQPEQVVLHGLPIRPAFSQRQPPPWKLRKQLGLRRDEPAVLLVGGGEGMGPVEKTVASIAAGPGARVQLVVVCGRNAKLVTRLSERTYPEGMHVIVKGFVNNMEQWMNACDMIITKAGPGTIAEAFICGLPVLLNAFIPCQEEGNIEYVVRNGTGIFSRDPQTIAATVEAWTGPDRAEFEAMAERAKALGKPDALFRIVRDLAELSKHSTAVSERREEVPALAS